jgi:hypothetical protein
MAVRTEGMTMYRIDAERDREGDAGTLRGARLGRRLFFKRAGYTAALVGTGGTLLGASLPGEAEAADGTPAYTDSANTFTRRQTIVPPRTATGLLIEPRYDEVPNSPISYTGRLQRWFTWIPGHSSGGRHPTWVPGHSEEVAWIDSSGVLSLSAPGNFGPPPSIPTQANSSAGTASTLSRSDHEHGVVRPYYVAAGTDGFTLESFPFFAGPSDIVGMTSNGVMSLWGISTLAQRVVTGIRFYSGATAAVGISHLWVAVYGGGGIEGGELLAQSDDLGTTTWDANASKDFILPTPPKVNSAGVYVALMCTADTQPSLVGTTFPAVFVGDTDVADIDTTHTGLTTTAPPGVGGTEVTLTNQLAYFRISMG